MFIRPETILLKDVRSTQHVKNALDFLDQRKNQVPRSNAVLKNSHTAMRLFKANFMSWASEHVRLSQFLNYVSRLVWKTDMVDRLRDESLHRLMGVNLACELQCCISFAVVMYNVHARCKKSCDLYATCVLSFRYERIMYPLWDQYIFSTPLHGLFVHIRGMECLLANFMFFCICLITIH